MGATARAGRRDLVLRKSAAAILLGAAGLCAASPAWAQPPQPGGRVTDQFERPPLPESQPVAPYRIERPGAGAAADGITFAVRRIEVEGVQAGDAAAIAELARPLEGRIVSFADLAALADRITAYYASRGYALSFALVPQQNVVDGVVRLRVVEGTVDAVRVEFSNTPVLAGRRRVEAAVRRRLSGLINSGPVRSAELERALLGIDDLAGLRPSVIIRPSESVEGAATLTVLIESDPIDAWVGADNRLRSEFGREEGYAGMAVNSGLIVGDRFEIGGRRSLERHAFSFWSVGYEAPIGDTLARAYAGYSRARTEAQSGLLGLLDYEGREESFRVGLRYPIIRSRARSLTVSAELGGIDTRSSLLDTPIVRDNIRTLSLGLSYDWADGSGARSLASLTIVQGLEALGATERGNPLASRALGRPDATHAIYRLYRDQPVAAGLRIRIEAEAQIASDPLLSASECTYGGPSLGRAYDAGVLSGDECLRIGGELARPFLVANQVVEPYAFLDWGLARQRGALEAGEERERDAASYGLGLRLFSSIGFNADVQVAWPAERLNAGDDRDARFFFTLTFQR